MDLKQWASGKLGGGDKSGAPMEARANAGPPLFNPAISSAHLSPDRAAKRGVRASGQPARVGRR
jgi:hypothetical protein